MDSVKKIQNAVAATTAQKAPLAEGKREKDLRKIKKLCRDVEAIFAYNLMKAMRETVPKSPNIVSSYSRDTYNMILDQKIAEDFADKDDSGGFQKILYKQLTSQYPKVLPGR